MPWRAKIESLRQCLAAMEHQGIQAPRQRPRQGMQPSQAGPGSNWDVSWGTTSLQLSQKSIICSKLYSLRLVNFILQTADVA